MEKYKFYQDRKVTSWERDYFSVEADSYEEAVNIIRSWGCDKRLFYDEWFALPETSERLLPEENGGCPTMEIFNQSGVSIMTNVPDVTQSN